MNRRIALIATISLPMFIGACATAPTSAAPQVATIQTDKFSPEIAVESQHVTAQMDKGETSVEWWLGTAIDKQSRIVAGTQLFAHIVYIGTDWCHYESAFDDTAASLAVTALNSHVSDCDENGSCIFSETFAAFIPSKKLDTAASFQVKVGALDCAPFYITVGTEQVNAQTAGIQKAMASLVTSP